MTTSNISKQIASTHSGLSEATLTQSNHTREKVDESAALVNVLREDLANTKQELETVSFKFSDIAQQNYLIFFAFPFPVGLILIFG